MSKEKEAAKRSAKGKESRKATRARRGRAKEKAKARRTGKHATTMLRAAIMVHGGIRGHRRRGKHTSTRSQIIGGEETHHGPPLALLELKVRGPPPRSRMAVTLRPSPSPGQLQGQRPMIWTCWPKGLERNFGKCFMTKRKKGQTTTAGAAAMPEAGADKAAGQPPPNRASTITALAVAPGPPPLPAAGPTSPQECQHERDTAGYIQHVQGGHYCRLCKRWAENAHLQSDTHKENCAQYAHLAPEEWYPELSADGKVVLPSDEQASVATAVAAAGGAPARASEAGIAGAAAAVAPAAPAAAGQPALTQTQIMWRAQWGVECRLAFVEMILGIDQTIVDANLEAAWYAAPPGLEPSE